MKEKRTYRRFNGVAFLAVLGCAGMFLFESVFVFELYNRVPSAKGSAPVVGLPPAAEQPTPAMEAPTIDAIPVAPTETPLEVPSEIPPAEVDMEPVVAPVG